MFRRPKSGDLINTIRDFCSTLSRVAASSPRANESAYLGESAGSEGQSKSRILFKKGSHRSSARSERNDGSVLTSDRPGSLQV